MAHWSCAIGIPDLTSLFCSISTVFPLRTKDRNLPERLGQLRVFFFLQALSADNRSRPPTGTARLPG